MAANHRLTVHYICLHAWVSVCVCICVCVGGDYIDSTPPARPQMKRYWGRLISHISETRQDKASQSAVGPGPICPLLSSNQGRIELF